MRIDVLADEIAFIHHSVTYPLTLAQCQSRPRLSLQNTELAETLLRLTPATKRWGVQAVLLVFEERKAPDLEAQACPPDSSGIGVGPHTSSRHSDNCEIDQSRSESRLDQATVAYSGGT